MKRSPLSYGVGLALILSLSAGNRVLAQSATPSVNSPVSSSTKPNLGSGPAVEKSVPGSAPNATRTQTTGATDQSTTVKTMNEKAKANVEANGK